MHDHTLEAIDLTQLVSDQDGNFLQLSIVANPGSGSFTWYYFGQGTAQEGGKYKTACGYTGTESGMTDTVSNIVNPTYFAAIPGAAPFAYAATGLALGPIYPTGLAWLAEATFPLRAPTAYVVGAAMTPPLGE